MIFLKLFYEFFKTGLFAVGGGLATVPFLQKLSVATGWFTSAELADMIAVAESTPGPIGVNTATYVGFTTGMDVGGVPLGILGAVVATLGLITPSIIVICIIATVLEKFRKSRYVEAAFYGFRPASVGLIAAAGFAILLIAFFNVDSIATLTQNFQLNWMKILLALLVLAMTRWVPKVKDLHPIVIILFSAVFGVIFSL